jgi:hypothetical protein
MSKLVAWILAEDVEGRELYLSYAREDRCAMWVRILDEGRVAKALRVPTSTAFMPATTAATSSMTSTSPDHR